MRVLILSDTIDDTQAFGKSPYHAPPDVQLDTGDLNEEDFTLSLFDYDVSIVHIQESPYHTIGYRGWRGTDSAGIILEPTLDAWGIKYYLVQSDEDVGKISIADKQAQETNKPVAILIVREQEP